MSFARKVKKAMVKKHVGFSGSATMEQRMWFMQGAKSFNNEVEYNRYAAAKWLRKHGKENN